MKNVKMLAAGSLVSLFAISSLAGAGEVVKSCDFLSMGYNQEKDQVNLEFYDVDMKTVNNQLVASVRSRQTGNGVDDQEVNTYAAEKDDDEATFAVDAIDELINTPQMPENLKKALVANYGEKVEQVKALAASAKIYKVGNCESGCAAELVDHLDADGNVIATSGMIGWGAMGFCQ